MARAADDTFAPSALTSGFRCVIYQTWSKPSIPDYLNQKGTNMKCQVNRFSILIFALFLLATYAVGIPDPSLVGYWPFDEKAGKKAEDVSGNGNDGKLIDRPK